jgi:hypothetical protein
MFLSTSPPSHLRHRQIFASLPQCKHYTTLALRLKQMRYQNHRIAHFSKWGYFLVYAIPSRRNPILVDLT